MLASSCFYNWCNQVAIYPVQRHEIQELVLSICVHIANSICPRWDRMSSICSQFCIALSLLRNTLSFRNDFLIIYVRFSASVKLKGLVSHYSISGSCYCFYFTWKWEIMFKILSSVHFQQESIEMRKLSQPMYQLSEGFKQHCWLVKWPPL